MNRTLALVVLALMLCTFARPSSLWAQPAPGGPFPLNEARKGFHTTLIKHEKIGQPAEPPPADLFTLVHYNAPAGALAAYISKAPTDGKKHPAIVWIIGGFSNSISATAWHPAKPENDQSASAFREAGIVMMYPSFRGGNDNPGEIECFFGEVDDALAAADYLAKQPFVNPTRIYLGGHSTGGTMALLLAESTDRFRAVFSFGPINNVSGYGKALTFDANNPQEIALRSPAKWINSIRTPTYVLEGNAERSNIYAVGRLCLASRDPQVHFYEVDGASHFSTLQPLTRLLARKILADQGPTADIRLTDDEIRAAMAR